MFANFLNRLLDPAPEPASDTDARLALGALLVRLARSDGDYAAVEKERIKHIMTQRYALAQPEAAALLADCEQLESEAPDTVRFTRAIKESVAYEDRLAVIKAMWQVVLADGERDEEENSIMRMVAPLLGIEDQDSNAARRAVETGQ